MQNPHVVITVHGIRTFGHWQDRLQRLLEEAEPGIEVYSYRCGYFSVVAFMVPFLRWLVTQRFRAALLSRSARAEGGRLDIVAHSFGTHLVAWALYGLPEQRRPRVHTTDRQLLSRY